MFTMPQRQVAHCATFRTPEPGLPAAQFVPVAGYREGIEAVYLYAGNATVGSERRHE